MAGNRLNYQSILLANRIGMLHTEAEKAKKQITDISKKMKKMLSIKRDKEHVYEQRISLMLNKDRYATAKREIILNDKEMRQRSIELQKEKIQNRKLSLAAEIKNKTMTVEQKIKRRAELLAMIKKGKAERLRESTKKTQEAKSKIERRKAKRVSRIYEKQCEMEARLMGKEQRKLDRLSVMENSMLEKVRNTQATQEVALMKFRTALTSKPSNYENYKKVVQEYNEKMRDFHRTKNLAHSICVTRSEALNRSVSNACSTID